MKITYYGHSCFGVEISGKHLLFDPFIRGNALASHIRIEDIPADYVLLSHGHGDHVGDAVEIALRSGATVVGAFEVASWAQGLGVASVHPMNLGGKKRFDFGTLKFVSAIHSSTLPDGSPGGHPGGFVIQSHEGTFYYSGDTALTYDMKLIGEQHKLDFAFLCIGDNFTMGVEDAIIAADFIRCDRIIGMHYDTFGYIVIDQEEARRRFAAAGRELLLPRIGESFEM
jgi:L-ascorbate metabolism protein UlaG (beta-lactamase superfamily)